MYGYEANNVLEMRNVRGWAGISRTQVYYSLQKLAHMNLIEHLQTTEELGPGAAETEKPGPDRRVVKTTAAGVAALADALEHHSWSEQLDRSQFLTWLALSWQCRPGVAKRQIQNRNQFLERELAHKEEMLDGVLKEVGHSRHEAVWMLKLTVQQIRVELMWLQDLKRELPKRAKAKKIQTDKLNLGAKASH